jgi:hypothetical protein
MSCVEVDNIAEARLQMGPSILSRWHVENAECGITAQFRRRDGGLWVRSALQMEADQK